MDDRETPEGANQGAALAQADGGEGAESAEEMQPAPQTYVCWDCGITFTPTTPNQRECAWCYVAGKL